MSEAIHKTTEHHLSLEVTSHPCSQTQEELDLLTGTQELWDHLRHQADEVQQLVVLHHAVLLHHLPHECRHESHWGDEELQGGCGETGARGRHCGEVFGCEQTQSTVITVIYGLVWKISCR